MFIHRIAISQEQILKLQNYKEAIGNYIFELFDK